MSSDTPSRSASGVEGRAAVVTGAARGIGFGIARALASRGALVAVFDIDEAAAEAAAGSIEAAHGPGIAFPYGVDLTSIRDVERSVADACRQMGSVDILVNNAGVITGPTDVDQLPEHDWDRVVGTNVKSQFLAARFAVPLDEALRIRPDHQHRQSKLARGGRKSALRRVERGGSEPDEEPRNRTGALWDHRQLHLAHARHHPAVRIDPEVRPGGCDAAHTVTSDPRPGTPEDIAHGVLFFADAAASFITGQHIYIGGGADLASGSP